VTHEYTLLVGGTVIPGGEAPDATAIAWAEGTVLAIGPEAGVRAISRGDSHFVDLHGAFVVPLAPDTEVVWPSSATLEVGGRADLAVLPRDPRLEAAGDVEARPVTPLALIRGGRVVTGTLPGVHGP
jgi:predicted amidohydrolase YtcJ